MRIVVPGLVLVAALAVAGCTTNPFNPPPPADSPGAYPPATAAPGQEAPPTTPASPDAPAPPVTEADLPTAADLVWNEGVQWTAGETTSGSGAGPVSVCQQNQLETLGANAVWVRSFEQSDNGAGAAAAMSFDTTALADQAYATLQNWTTDCAAALQRQGHTDGQQGIPVTPITVPNGRAQFTEWSYRTTASEDSEFESLGLYQVGDRVGLLMMRIRGEDNNWDLEPDGPVGELHPQIRSVPPVAAKLAP